MDSSSADFDKKYNIVDAITPKHTLLTGRYKKSFAFHTLKERLPVILTQIIDSLTKEKDEISDKYQGEKTREEIKTIVGHISKLKYQLQTDKPFENFVGCEPDRELWNGFIDALPENARSFYQTAWLYGECYMYRKVFSFFENSETLKSYDYFFKQKAKGLEMDEVAAISKRLRSTEKNFETFSRLLKLNLWGNKCDLSLIIPTNFDPNQNVYDNCTKFDDHILVDNTKSIWDCLESADQTKPVVVDIVLDNAGFEFYTDLILAEYLLEKNLASKVRFHSKPMPWFVSDVTPSDFHYTFEYLSNHKLSYLNEQGQKWKEYVAEGKFELATVSYFWCSPIEYYKMREVDFDLYKYLGEAHLVIFKGDLNYRKLLGDMNWDPTDDFLTCLRGFQPTNLCTLRTVKADVICGLKQGKAEELFRLNPKWMETGEYGLIKFMESSQCRCINDS
ncbi:damage-control phosphatase ARMT1-like isoform X1 [Musca autumnalis]|uniref:damage-control phosphatase ARMT1-like isoform X1 n=1 Tax=Musca autumnalis TaxID=221902 RepID=UPI003CE9B2B1